ncbi:MAG: hypothetical protein WBA13_19620 [Microcoleaceae cyanobacterium]
MKRLQIFAGLLIIGVMTTPEVLNAQPLNTPSVEVNNDTEVAPTPNSTVQLSFEQIRAACAARRYDLLPIPFSDVSPTDWAFEAVMNLYYCIGLPPLQSRSKI